MTACGTSGLPDTRERTRRPQSGKTPNSPFAHLKRAGIPATRRPTLPEILVPSVAFAWLTTRKILKNVLRLSASANDSARNRRGAITVSCAFKKWSNFFHSQKHTIYEKDKPRCLVGIRSAFAVAQREREIVFFSFISLFRIRDTL